MATLLHQYFTFEDLLVAYRKAKYDAYYERNHVSAAAFCSYEENLIENLESILALLTDPQSEWWADPGIYGSYTYIPKRIDEPQANQRETPKDSPCFSVLLSDEDKRWIISCQSSANKKPKATFRLVGKHPVAFHVISALWILKVGHQYDAILSRSVRGSRLRRRKPENGKGIGTPNRIALGSFQPYAPNFRAWRAEGLQTIRSELNHGRKVVAVTTDVRSFYHCVCPTYLLEERFLERAGINLSPEDKEFTDKYLRALLKWNRSSPSPDDTQPNREPLGVPVGLSAPRVIANALLWGFDEFIERDICPLYYGRYVDDIFLVLRNDQRIETAKDFWSFLQRRSDATTTPAKLIWDGTSDDIRIDLDYSPESEIFLAPKKSKVFVLDDGAGLSLIEAIEHNIQSVSSEWRLLPELPENEHLTNNEFLIAGKESSEEIDGLRKADKVSIRKLRMALRLRDLEAAQRDLHSETWRRHRGAFFRAILQHVVSINGIFDFYTYIPRFIGLAIACGDWRESKKIISKLSSVLSLLRATCDVRSDIVDAYKENLLEAIEEATAKAIGPYQVPNEELEDVISELRSIGSKRTTQDLIDLGRRLFVRDLARDAWRQILLDDELLVNRSEWLRKTPKAPATPSMLKALGVDKAREFLCEREADIGTYPAISVPLVFPTRPLLVSEITQLSQGLLYNLHLLRSTIQGIRGATMSLNSESGNLSPPLPPNTSNRPLIRIPYSNHPKDPIVALACIRTEEVSWKAAVARANDPSIIDPEESRRYFSINRLVNDVIRAQRRPDYFVFPELCLPRRWFSRISHKLSQSNISLVAGLEYKHWADGSGTRFVSNPLRACLVTDAVGTRSTVIYEQEKSTPAVGEETDLSSIANLTMRPISQRTPYPVILHGNSSIGFLICSELTNIELRGRYRGDVDILFVLEWNRDLESFSQIVEATALDTHCFVVQANNGLYGDSRIRAPYREAYRRDIARVKGGINDYVVLAPLETSKLRAFQSRFRSSPNGLFKPTPDGFQIAPWRRVVPD